MNKIKYLGMGIASVIVLGFPTQALALPAFPGAEGFGADTKGGRGGKVYEVTNLNDSGTGSLRECINATGPRICVFKVGGTIKISTSLKVMNPYITIAGQTAPGGGIVIRNVASLDPLLFVKTHDVVVRYLSMRQDPKSAGDSLNVQGDYNSGVYNVVIDHCSMAWGVDQIAGQWYDVHKVSWQWNYFVEGLMNSTHEKGSHSKGPLLGSAGNNNNHDKPGARNITYHHNLVTHAHERTPLVKTWGLTEIINSVTYNPWGAFSHVDMENSMQQMRVNYIGNYFIRGPQTNSAHNGVAVVHEDQYGAKIYLKDNKGPNSNFADSETQKYVVSTPNTTQSEFPATHIAVTTTDPVTAYNQILESGGNSRGLNENGQWYARRDAVDKRATAEIKAKSGKWIDAQSKRQCVVSSCIYLTETDYTKYGISKDELEFDSAGFTGFPKIVNGTGYRDSDHDGMSDVWEDAQGLDKNNASDGNADKDGDGYTNVEEFLNGSGSTSGTIPTQTPRDLRADANNDGSINDADYAIWLTNYNPGVTVTQGKTVGDFNNNGKVDGEDYAIWIKTYGI